MFLLFLGPLIAIIIVTIAVIIGISVSIGIADEIDGED